MKNARYALRLLPTGCGIGQWAFVTMLCLSVIIIGSFFHPEHVYGQPGPVEAGTAA